MDEQPPYTFPFSEEIRRYAEETLNETEERRLAALREIRAWFAIDNKVHGDPSSSAILPFLRGCKFNMERTKEKLTRYYRLRRDTPQWFAERDPARSDIQELVQLGVFVPLRQLHRNRLVVIIRTGAHDPTKHSQDDVFKTGKMLLDVATRTQEIVQIYGVVAVFDMADVGWRHARQMTVPRIRRAVHAWQNYHSRAKQLEFVNAPAYINVVLDVFKRFMSTKLQGRVRVHYSGSASSLADIVSPDVLPVEYGGTDGTLKQHIEHWNHILLEHRDWFKEDEQYKSC